MKKSEEAKGCGSGGVGGGPLSCHCASKISPGWWRQWGANDCCCCCCVGRRLVSVADGGGMGRRMVIDFVVGGNVRLMVSWVEG